MAIRGGDPRQTGIYLDGHPIPRAFHVVPIASVVDPAMVDRVELTPGNYDAAYGGYAGGLLEIHTRPGPLIGDADRAIHGEAHLDLFDVGGGFRAPVGVGAIAFGFRRSHVGDIFKFVDREISKTGILLPEYWDYIGRFDLPLGDRHRLTIKALGAGDGVSDVSEVDPENPVALDFSASFHRLDVGYAFTHPRVQASLSAALLLDTNSRDLSYTQTSRTGWTLSVRGSANYRVARRATLLSGFDLAESRAIQQVRHSSGGYDDETRRFTFGTWLRGRAAALAGAGSAGDSSAGPPQRVREPGRDADHARSSLGRARARASAGRAVRRDRPVLVAGFDRARRHARLARPDAADLDGDHRCSQLADLVLRSWLRRRRPRGLSAGRANLSGVAGHANRAALGAGPAHDLVLAREPKRAADPRGGLRRALRRRLCRHLGPGDPRLRARGARRSHARRRHPRHARLHAAARPDGGVSEGIDFFQLRDEGWIPTVFDQRHNLVALVVFDLPRGFRFGARFRLVSGNPEAPVIGTLVTQSPMGFDYEPIRGELGTSYGPLFHQLDLRIDKTWYAKWISIIAYLDVQNVYNHLHPEIWVYSVDWTERSQRVGLPIFPSLGLRIEF
ncbi:MAG: TonB-dependent receptor plug domain-containing protein [Deltaproteobacteria bacterium]|nr:TonB-dependent receptor plug domain-containing protein [Deltaproteobacteria bacterium]